MSINIAFGDGVKTQCNLKADKADDGVEATLTARDIKDGTTIDMVFRCNKSLQQCQSLFADVIGLMGWYITSSLTA